MFKRGESEIPLLYANFNALEEVGGVATMALLRGIPVTCAVPVGSVWVNSTRCVLCPHPNELQATLLFLFCFDKIIVWLSTITTPTR